MFTQKFVRGSLTLALVLTAGSAVAAPARGYRDAFAVSENAAVDSGASYRDSARHEVQEGGTATAASGYRDRFAQKQVTARQTALATDAARQ